MYFGLNKWVKVTFKKGSRVKSKNITLDIKKKHGNYWEHNEIYKHLGNNEPNGVKDTISKPEIKKKLIKENNTDFKNRTECKK